MFKMEDKKLNVCNEDPNIYTIDNYLTDNECQHMIDISKDIIQPSLVSGEKKGYISEDRTGQNCWIKHDHDEITLSIANKISEQLNIPLDNAESFQVLHYNKNQEYKNYYDSWDFNGDEKSRRNMKYGGQRMITTLVYLNDVQEGGETKFTKLDIKIDPKKGRLLVFSNVEKDSNIKNKLSEHSGLPVIEGEKWVFNLWFREKSRNILYDYPEYLINKQIDYSNNNNHQEANDVLKENKNEDPNQNYKLSMNNEWRNWVLQHKKKNINLKIIEQRLKKQNYSPALIHQVLYQNERLLPDNSKIKDKILEDQFPDQFLEVGDYFPFIKIGIKEMHNIVDSKNILIFNIVKIDQNIIDNLIKLKDSNHLFIIYQDKSDNLGMPMLNYCIHQSKIPKLLKNDQNIVYILEADRRIKDIQIFDNIDQIINLKIEKSLLKINVPYLMIENVLDKNLLNRILKFYDEHNQQHILHNSNNKNRLHVFPDEQLEKMIDNKLSRSLFPEIRKIFYFDVEYRELYKICSYNSETNGRFAAHRDTPYPHQHRKFALSLILNDDYEGGELLLPEYHVSLKPKANTAIVFPGICSHQVNPIISGSRKTIITFFCTKKLDDPESNKRDRVKSNFFTERKVENSLIYPF